VILPDVNLLVYAFNRSAPLHKKAASWWEDQINGGQAIGVPWPVFAAFVRLMTGRLILEDPYTPREVFEIAAEWWARPNVRLLEPTAETYRRFRALMEAYELSGSATSDALIASFALEHRARLATNDTDFLRFRELRVVNPLQEGS
jgi:toxin-antitoxin system PIN domain toxin